MCNLLSIPLSLADGVQDRGVGDMGLHREQSRGKHPWDPLVLILAPTPHPTFTAVSFPQCQASVEATEIPESASSTCLCFLRCLMELSSSSLWPPWWPPQWPTAPAAPGTLSASSSHCASGGSRGSLMVRLGESREGGGQGRGLLTSPHAASRPLLSGHRDRYCGVL